jgi:16S rRNA U516 pseudouridylate synthase RsuA-like enzyme
MDDFDFIDQPTTKGEQVLKVKEIEEEKRWTTLTNKPNGIYVVNAEYDEDVTISEFLDQCFDQDLFTWVKVKDGKIIQ